MLKKKIIRLSAFFEKQRLVFFFIDVNHRFSELPRIRILKQQNQINIFVFRCGFTNPYRFFEAKNYQKEVIFPPSIQISTTLSKGYQLETISRNR